MLCDTRPGCAVLCHAMLCYAMLCYMLCYAALWFALLCCLSRDTFLGEVTRLATNVIQMHESYSSWGRRATPSLRASVRKYTTGDEAMPRTPHLG